MAKTKIKAVKKAPVKSIADVLDEVATTGTGNFQMGNQNPEFKPPKENDLEDIEKPYEINSATIKEELCNYGYEIKTGPGAGDKIPTRKGSAIVHDDMITAFSALNIHLCLIDDVFKYSGNEPESLDDLEDNEVLESFKVSGFKIQGNEDNEGYVLIGEKWVTTGAIGLETPKITKGSSYKFFDELQEAIVHAREEVEAYMNGKCAPKYEQLKMELPESEVNHFAEENI